MPGEVSLSIPVPTYRSVSSAATVRSGKKVKFGEIDKLERPDLSNHWVKNKNP